MTPWSDVTATHRLRGPQHGAPASRLPEPEDLVNVSALTPICIPLPKKPCAWILLFANSHPFRVINKIGDRKLIQPSDALFMPRHTVMIDLQQLIYAN